MLGGDKEEREKHPQPPPQSHMRDSHTKFLLFLFLGGISGMQVPVPGVFFRLPG